MSSGDATGTKTDPFPTEWGREEEFSERQTGKLQCEKGMSGSEDSQCKGPGASTVTRAG